MKIKATSSILDYDGLPLKENEIKLSKQILKVYKKLCDNNNITSPFQIIDNFEKEIEKSELTYRAVINNALNSLIYENDKPEVMTATDKSKCYEITKKLFDSKEPDFTEDQIDLIIKRVEKIYLQPLICGRIKDVFKRK